MPYELRPELERYLERRHPRARVRRLRRDAKGRSVYRVLLPESEPRLLIDYGRPLNEEPDDEVMGRVFAEAEIRTPAILEHDLRVGCLVVEDLGDRTLASAIGRLSTATDAERIEALYRQSVRLAAEIADRGTKVLRRSVRSAGPARDAGQFRQELDFFAEHFVRGLVGLDRLPDGLARALHELAEQAAASPRVLCHGHFRTAEILVLNDDSLALPDVTGSCWGPDTYDLSYLVRDPDIDIDEDFVVTMVETYRWSLSDHPEPSGFRARFQVLSAQVLLQRLGSAAYDLVTVGDRDRALTIRRGVSRLARVLPAIPGQETLTRIIEDAGLFTPPPEVLPRPDQG